jgi:hypothetical protein
MPRAKQYRSPFKSFKALRRFKVKVQEFNEEQFVGTSKCEDIDGTTRKPTLLTRSTANPLERMRARSRTYFEEKIPWQS